MSIYTSIGRIVRALPRDEALDIKLQTPTGSLSLEVPSDRPELMEEARSARVSETEVRVRHTGGGLVVALQANDIARAA